MYTQSQRSMRFLLVITVLLLASLACSLARTRTPTPAPVPVSTEAVDALEKEIESAAATAASGGEVNLTITEQQLTSAAVFALQQQPDAPIEDFQVHLRSEQMQISGRVVNQGTSLSFKVALKLSVDPTGKLQYEIISAKLGSISLPQFVIDEITSQIDSVLTSQLSTTAGDLNLKQITINEGYLTIIGSLR
ncbi:MAG: hypothetical protein AB1894_06570 [Chloroflexota bacterium]